jgi:hypothetical protein
VGQEEVKGIAGLTNSGIAETLAEVVTELKEGRIEQTATRLRRLDFERLMRPIVDPTDRKRSSDPGTAFGLDRVHETGHLIRACLVQLKQGYHSDALVSAQAALLRWGKKKGK